MAGLSYSRNVKCKITCLDGSVLPRSCRNVIPFILPLWVEEGTNFARAVFAPDDTIKVGLCDKRIREGSRGRACNCNLRKANLQHNEYTANIACGELFRVCKS